MANFKDRFKELRQEMGLSQREVGLHLGYSESTISLYESGEREPKKIEDIIKIADYFNVSSDYLFGRVNNKNCFISEHTINGQTIKIGAGKDNFPNGISDKQASDYIELAKVIKTLVLSNEDLNLLLKLKEMGFTFQHIDAFREFREANINTSDLELLKTIKKHLNNK